jgi:hypothetical protein
MRQFISAAAALCSKSPLLLGKLFASIPDQTEKDIAWRELMQLLKKQE